MSTLLAIATHYFEENDLPHETIVCMIYALLQIGMMIALKKANLTETTLPTAVAAPQPQRFIPSWRLLQITPMVTAIFLGKPLAQYAFAQTGIMLTLDLLSSLLEKPSQSPIERQQSPIMRRLRT
jgi:hypothetical protein